MALDELDHEIEHAIYIFSKVRLCETSLYIAKEWWYESNCSINS